MVGAKVIDGRVALVYDELDPYGNGEMRTVERMLSVIDAGRLSDELIAAIKEVLL